MSGYPHHPPGYGYGAPPPASQPYGSGPYGAPPPQGYATPYAAPPPPQPHGQSPYAPPAQPYGGAPSAPPYDQKPHKEKPPKDQSYSASAGYPPSASNYSPFATLVPSTFPPGTDPNVVACFRIADQDGSGLIDDLELQRALSSYNQSFSLRTVHLLMYLFTYSNAKKIG